MKIDLDVLGRFYRSRRSGELVELVEIEFSPDGKLAVYDWTNEQTGISGRRQCDYGIFMKLFSRVEDNNEEFKEGGKKMIKAIYVEFFREQLQKEIEIAQHEMEQAKGKIEGLRIALKNLDDSHEKHTPDTEVNE